MPIRRLLLENYRGFRNRQEIELAPITVVLGKNNSGKSALTRAPLVIATGFDTTSPSPLDLERLGPDAVDDLRELYFDQLDVRPLTLGVTVDGPLPFTLRVDLEYSARLRNAVVAALRVDTDDSADPVGTVELVSSRFTAPMPDTSDIDGVELSTLPEPSVDGLDEYDIRISGGPTRTRQVRFAGLLPAAGQLPDLDDLFRQVRPGLIRYLGPYRERVARQHRMPIGTPAVLGTKGEGLAGLLADSQRKSDGRLLAQINAHFREIVPGWRLEEVPAGPLWSTVLVRDGSRARINLADAGSGLAQVLPILAQCAMDELAGITTAPPLQIIEEPEAHLHPRVHADLADLYLRTAQRTGTRFLIETHSETLLLRLRRRIAEVDNDYGPETVAIYVVEQHDGVSSARRIPLDSLGNLDDSWPPGYFSQDYHEVRALAAAQSERNARAS
ncbi:AAA family ATPase [Solwaraspora sp. WMMA2065]|uniref:AAA family ATPase n=1 Tax=unclassified Solwaraspora TaxID=2627926 RepID=UPI00259B1BDC|nr:AAA family ATPase [Solwaraspora sp. WMMA2065]WJK33924.1 AAA family ATPase [Solwaraspora sp. WMMA2065]